MKRLFTLFFLLIPLLSIAQEAPKPEKKKFYIEPTQIGFSNNKIFIQFEDEWQAIDAIYADKEGLYIMPPYFNYDWTCKLCTVTNEFWRSLCRTPDCEATRPLPPVD